MFEEIKKGNFKLKKPEDKRDEKIEKAKEENKTFVKLDKIGSTFERTGSTKMGICQQKTSSQPVKIEETANEEVLG